METVIYKGISSPAKEVRQKVFVDEQGFHNEFDDVDETATHILGRLAVIKEYRGKNIGSFMVLVSKKFSIKRITLSYGFVVSLSYQT